MYGSRSKYAFCEDNETDNIMKEHDDDDDEHNTLDLERMDGEYLGEVDHKVLTPGREELS